ncbi:hypothetical protein AQUCO_09600031v1 [Aquilegia coerulea]|uniref:Uncharacterized protein n=1 Tax=Aquilegia coerulea TaxID=218851 RepID=A0A2G5C4N1_AQUCA|nr:hypothetical protein AQUCO_09600031v1 [Aquilegia coerulea]PIA26191.1 hypothetical protein AQUCO_09600031v1 [Aquilegia coerulea]
MRQFWRSQKIDQNHHKCLLLETKRDICCWTDRFGVRVISYDTREMTVALYVQTAFTNKKDYGHEEREAQWPMHREHYMIFTKKLFREMNSFSELSEIAEQAQRQAEDARLQECHTQRTCRLS